MGNHPGKTVCTLYDSDVPNQQWSPRQIMCRPRIPRSYTTYENKQCVGTGTDILRDFQGTVAECKAKCDELDCIGFIRVHSGASQHTGRCYFRGGDMERPYDYSSDDRDCYIPGHTNGLEPNKWLLVLNQDLSSGGGYFASDIASTG